LDVNTKNILNTFIVPYGSFVFLKEGAKLKKGDKICSWDPYNAVILSDLAGKIVFDNIIDGITFREENDEVTGYGEKVVIETKDKTKTPSIRIVGKDKTVLKEISLPVGAHLAVEEGKTIIAGDIIAKIPRSARGTRDITGGLPRVTELFEARNPSNPATVAEIDGVVTYGGIKRGNREIAITSKDGEVKHYMIPLSKHIFVQDNDYIKAGSLITDRINPYEQLMYANSPISALFFYLVDWILPFPTPAGSPARKSIPTKSLNEMPWDSTFPRCLIKSSTSSIATSKGVFPMPYEMNCANLPVKRD
jgi:DNA-directed RNA polymerase subunit beta'